MRASNASSIGNLIDDAREKRKERANKTRRIFHTYPKSAWAMSRTLYSRPAEDVSTTHMEELMVNVGRTDYFVARAGK